MDHGTYKFWFCSVHVVSDSTTSFRNASKKVTDSLPPQCHMQEHVHGNSQKIMSGCVAPGLQEEAKRHKWYDHKYYQKGIHTPMRFIFWNFNDIVDGTGELNG
eukprot:8841520-Pyramimonas_sp.AAC.1